MIDSLRLRGKLKLREKNLGREQAGAIVAKAIMHSVARLLRGFKSKYNAAPVFWQCRVGEISRTSKKMAQLPAFSMTYLPFRSYDDYRTVNILEAATWKTRLQAVEMQKAEWKLQEAESKKRRKEAKKVSKLKKQMILASKGDENASSPSPSPSSNSSTKEGRVERFPDSAGKKVRSSGFGRPLDRIRSGDFRALSECHRIAKQMAHNEPFRNKKIYGYNILMQALLKRAKNDPRLCSKACNHILEILRYVEKTFYLHPNTITYNLALKAVVLLPPKGKCVDGDAALEILASMKSSQWGKPDNISYSTVIDALGRSSERREGAIAAKCIALLQEMKDNEELPNPDKVTYNAVLHALASVSHEDMTEKCLDLIREMKDSDDENIRPDGQTYSALLRGLANNAEGGNPKALEKMSEILESMGNVTNVIHCNIYLNALVKNASTQLIQDGATDRCMSFLGEMILSDTHKPDRITYNTAMNFLVKMVNEGDDEAAEKCLVLLDEMKNSSETPDVVTYSTAMKAFCKLAEKGHDGAAHTNVRLLREMQERQTLPDLYTYSIVLQTLVNALSQDTGDGDVDTCMEILNEMKESENASVTPNTIHYTKVLNAFVQKANISSDADTSAMMIDSCLLLLDEMKRFPMTQPDVVAYSSVLSAVAKQIMRAELSPDRGLSLVKQCFTLLDDMEGQPDAAPNTLTYMTIAQPMLRRIESDDEMIFDNYLLLMAKGSASNREHGFMDHKMQPANNPFLVPLLEVMLKMANQGLSSVVDNCIAIIDNCDKYDPAATVSDFKRANYTFHCIIKALVLHSPPGSTSEVNRSDRPFQPLRILNALRDSEFFQPSIQTFKAVIRGLTNRAQKLEDRISVWEALNVLDQAKIDHGLDDVCVLLGIEALTAVPAKDSEENVVSIILRCMEFIERCEEDNLRADDNCFSVMLNYCVNALKVCDLSLVIPLYGEMLKGTESKSLRDFKLEKISLKFLEVLKERITRGHAEAHMIGDEILETGQKVSNHRFDCRHLNQLLHIKIAVSYETASAFLCKKDVQDLNLIALMNEESIDILIKSLCMEKHRTDHSEIMKRIDYITSIMQANNIRLSKSSKALLQEYCLIDEFN